jgi:hypothetical protein
MLQNFVQESANAPGTATTINLAGAAAGRRGFLAAFASGAAVWYFMDDGTQAEWGQGVVTAGSPNTLTRATVIGNTAGTTARLNFTGAVRVYNFLPAEAVGYVALQRVTVGTPVATVDFTLPAWASVVRAEWEGVAPVGGAGALVARISTDNGATYLSAGGSYEGPVFEMRAAGTSSADTATLGFMSLTPNLATAGVSLGMLQMDRAGSASTLFHCMGQRDDGLRFARTGGYVAAASVPTNLRFLMTNFRTIAGGSRFTLLARV